MRSLAIKYRPKTFDEVIGHEAVVKILKNQINKRMLGNAILLSGKSGSGKTTVARIIANNINNGNGTPIEIDAASNSGVDNVREIIKNAQERAIDCEYKVFIIDEAQSLSSTAWQAFLKCIEEPPKYTIFIFCTTDPQKIPPTIINRVQRFDFTNIPTSKIVGRLRYVCEREGFTNYEESINYIGKLVNGCMREALTLLDKCSDYSEDLSINNIEEVLGVTSYAKMFSLVDNVLNMDQGATLKTLDSIFNAGVDLKLFVDSFLEFLINVQKYNIFKDCNLTIFPSVNEQDIKNITNFENPEAYFNYLINKIFMIKTYIKEDTDIKSTIEVTFMQILRGQ